MGTVPPEVTIMRQNANAVTLFMLGCIVGCSSSSSSQPPANSPQLAAAVELTPRVTLQKTDKGVRIFGPGLELIRDDQGIRGQSASGIVDINPTKDGFSGVIGTGTTNIHIEPTVNGYFNMRGMFAGGMGNLEVSEKVIQGKLGPCQFDLNATPSTTPERTYSGYRICGGKKGMTTLTLTSELLELKEFDRAAVITLMLLR
jgi:hypothetical protein